MFELFKAYIDSNRLFSPSDKLIVGISGGIDSVVLAHLLKQGGYQTVLAHCNFNLRGEESGGDEIFVRQFAKALDCPLEVKQFNTLDEVDKRGGSVQMVARDLRYEWFEELRKNYSAHYILVAHQQNDQAETFFINLLRGSGIAGLRGMLNKRDKIARPLLFANRSTIEDYARQNQLKFREDSSNSSEKYLRSAIRHKLLPILEELNKDVVQTIAETTDRLKAVEYYYKKISKNIIENSSEQKGDEVWINIEKLQKEVYPETLLFDFLAPYGFNASQIEQMMAKPDAQAGKRFFGNGYWLLKDREYLILARDNGKSSSNEVVFNPEDRVLDLPLKLEFNVVPMQNFQLIKDSSTASLNFDKIKTPLVLSRWKEGDFFYPLGMKGKMKLSDYFINNKVNLFQKENIWVLKSGADIVWLVGHRIDERYKIKDNTGKVLFVKFSDF